MRDWDPDFLEALEGHHRTAVAVQLTLLGGAVHRWTSVAEGVTIGGHLFSPTVLEVNLWARSGATALSRAQIALPALAALGTAIEEATLVGAELRTWLLVTPELEGPWLAEELDPMIVEQPVRSHDQVALVLGPPGDLWRSLVPPAFGAACWYQHTDLCPHVATCARTPAACTANGQAEIFGGDDYLPRSGDRIEFREQGMTLGGGEGAISPRGVVRVRY